MRVQASFPVVFAVVATALLAACQGQGEGQLCDTRAGNGGNDDCQSGLTCQSGHGVVMSPFGICCPANGPATTSACSTTGTSLDANPAPPDASPVPPSGQDSGASSDATVE